MTHIYGYADPLAARAGSSVSFMLSTDIVVEADTQLVRLVHGDTNPDGPGFVEIAVEHHLAGTVTISPQRAPTGSYAAVAPSDILANVTEGTLHAFICPTAPGNAEQAIAGCWDTDADSGYLLLINGDGRLCLRLGGGPGRISEICLSKKLVARCWYFVSGAWNSATGEIGLCQKARINRWNSLISPVSSYDLDDELRASLPASFAPSPSKHFLIGAADGRAICAHYNGKIDRPGLHRGIVDAATLEALSEGETPQGDAMLAYWDTSLGYTDGGIDDRIRDIGPAQLDAMGVNRPIRGMTGWNWQGRDDSYRLNPQEFGGIAFHDDALVDCKWASTLHYDIPVDLKSGVYALRVRANGMEEHIPFFVRPAEPVAALAVLMPTFTYLAYANEQFGIDNPVTQAITSNVPVLTQADLDWAERHEFGASTYDLHSDGQGICYSSWRRPIFNLGPRYRMTMMGVPWAFGADLSLLWWLEHAGFDYDILTDHDLDREGLSALSPYKAVVTGTHPEYYSTTMLDATEDYLSDGGRVLYLGGNGYYWVTAVRPDEPWCIEVRRLETGMRAWQAAAGEAYLATTGERSGIWRARGRPPQKIVGVGFTTQGFDRSRPFERLPDSHDPRVGWIFDGIGDDELIGDFGLALGGAAGAEMDRYDLSLGTPPHALLLASSFEHSDNYPLVVEDVFFAFAGRGGTQDHQVRGDIVYFTTANGGGVFAAGSIAWSQALPCHGGDNNVARILGNVLRRFCADDDLPA